jgi:hypothetical protein
MSIVATLTVARTPLGVQCARELPTTNSLLKRVRIHGGFVTKKDPASML